MRKKSLGPEFLWGRTPARCPGWVVAGFCSLSQRGLPYSLWLAPSPLSPQPLLSSRILATQPSLVARILGNETPAVETEARELWAECFQPSPPPPPSCHEGFVHLPKPSLLARANPEGGCRPSCLEDQLWPQVLKGAAGAQEEAPAGLLQVIPGSGAIACHQLP